MNKTEKEPTKKIVGPNNESMPVKGLRLGIEKFQHPFKHFRLIWIQGERAWPAIEDQTRYRRKYGEGGAVAAGQAMADEYEVKFCEITR